MTVPSVQHFLTEHERFEANGASGSPEWVRDLRNAAIRKFEENGFPTTRDEAWRFTSIKPVTERSYRLGSGTANPDVATIKGWRLSSDAYQVVVSGGAFAAGLSETSELPAGLTITSLALAAEQQPELVSRHLGTHASLDNPFAALGTAFLRDGVFVHVADNVEIDRPIEIVFVGAENAAVEHPRTLIVQGANSSVKVVENFRGTPGAEYLRNAVTEIVLGQGARMEMCRVQREPETADHMASTHVHQERDSVFTSTFIALGSRLSRHDIRTVLDGEGAECNIRGLYLLENEQHVDHHTVIDHAKPNCNSNEFLNGVLDGKSRAVFTGRIIVREDAQKTDSKQSNNNVLLSESARADSQPQLEIYADDVRCTHGATLGPLNQDSILYLRTRGIGEHEARRMLTYGFGVEIIDAIGMHDVRDVLNAAVRERLGVEA